MRATVRFGTVLGLALLLASCGKDGSSGVDSSPVDASVGPDGAVGPDAYIVDGTPGEIDARPAFDALPGPDGSAPEGTTIDHRHTDLGVIPAGCLADVKASTAVFHYTHRSHGSQLVVGAESLEASDSTYAFEASYCAAPSGDVLKMWDGMSSDNLIEPEEYWATSGGLDAVRALLTAHPELRYSLWAWSFEINEQTEQSIDQYLAAIATLQGEFPSVTFILMTGPAVSYLGVNRAARNAQIRAWAETHSFYLYDFEDLDAWYNGEHATGIIDGETVPIEHPHYSLETAGNVEYQWTHTTRDSCENKARAFWTLVATLEGCAF